MDNDYGGWLLNLEAKYHYAAEHNFKSHYAFTEEHIYLSEYFVPHPIQLPKNYSVDF